MSLSPTAQRILRTLPDYYLDNPIVARVLQAWANEIDRIDGWLDELKIGLIPGAGDDSLGLLSVWEQTLRRPIAPSTVTVQQRQADVGAAIAMQSVSSARDFLAILADLIGDDFTIDRNVPAPGKDTIAIPFVIGSYEATRTEDLARRAWPLHRDVFVQYNGGAAVEVVRY